MIAIKCPGCGFQLESSEAGTGGEIECPKCGRHWAGGVGANSSETIPSRPSAAHRQEAAQASAATPLHDSSADTLKPTAPDEELFSFLAPPIPGTDDLGQLGHYRILRLLGKGGMGIVFEAIDTQLQRKVALKVMRPDVAKDELARKRFLREAQATASVRSDHIVVIHHVQQDDIPYLAMEFLQGEPLDRWMMRRGRLSLQEVLRVAIEVARGLSQAHQAGLIHRDIKPANIWLDSSTGRVKILDFGLARLSQEQVHLTRAGMVMGTPAYMAPEQAEGVAIDARADLFSLGCVLYEMVTGKPPFTGANTMQILLAVANKTPPLPAKVNAEVPAPLSELIMRLLEKEPGKRPATAREVAQILESIAERQGYNHFTPASPRAKLDTQVCAAMQRDRSGRRRLVIALAVILLVIGVGLAYHFAAPLLWPGFNRHTAPGVTGDTIFLGMSGPFTGPSRELGREMDIGLRTYFRLVNDHGGVHGRKIELVSLDDGYEPKKALECMHELHAKPVFAYIGNIGTPTAEVTMPYATEKKQIFFGAFSGAKFLRRDPPNRYVFNYRASYVEETARIVHYLLEVREVKPNEIAVFAQNDAYGAAGYEGVAKMLRGKTANIVHVRYERNTSKVDQAVKTILAHPEIRAVVMAATYEPAAAFIRRLKDAHRNLIFSCVSFVGSEALAGELKALGPQYVDGVIVTQVVPPIHSDATIVLKYQENLQKYFPGEAVSFTSLEGYIDARLFVEGLKRAGDDLTTDSLIDALESIRDLDLGTGAKLEFSISRHQASNRVWGTELDKDGRFHEIDLD